MRIRQGNDFIFLWAIERNGQPEDFSNAVNIRLHFKNFDCIGEVESFQIVDGNIVRVEVTPEWASRLGAYRLILSYEFEDLSLSDGDQKCVVDVLAFNIVPKTSEADDVTEMAKTTDIMIGLKGDKGDPFTYDDFTPEQIEDLKRPAIEAAESVQIVENQISINEQGRVQAENERETAESTRVSNENNRVTAEGLRVNAESLRVTAESSRESAESLRVEAELLRQSSTQTAISNAENATENANTAAQNADDARLAIQDDLALKANHGYSEGEEPKTLKQVEDDTSVKMTNLFQNSSFENGVIEPTRRTSGGDGASTLSINTINPISGNYDARLEVTTPGTRNDRPILYLNGGQNEWVLDHIFYFGMSVKVNNGTPAISRVHNGASNIYLDLTLKDGFNSWAVECLGPINFGVTFLDGTTLWDFNFDNLIAYDLTAIFGEGNEPTKEEMDLLISTLGIDYFEGEITIPAQKIMQWLLGSQQQSEDKIYEKADHGYSEEEEPKTLKEVDDDLVQLESDVEQLAYVKIKNEVVNGNFENGLIAPFSKADAFGGTSTLVINSSTPISGNYDIRLTITTPATGLGRPLLNGLDSRGDIGDKIYLHFYAKILSGIPIINAVNNGAGTSAIYSGDVVNGRNTRIIDVVGTSSVGTIYFNSMSVWDMQMDNFMRINLTETFGAGNEPTEEEMDLLISTLGIDYFEGEITIPAQKIMQWQLALIRKNKNAIIALGGTII